jgi:hypothetical protein
MNLFVYRLGISHRASNFRTQQFAVPLAQTMNERLHSSEVHVELLGDLFV